MLLKAAGVLPNLLMRPEAPAGCLFESGMAQPEGATLPEGGDRIARFYRHKPPLMAMMDSGTNAAACYRTIGDPSRAAKANQRSCFCQMLPKDGFIPKHPEGIVLEKKMAVIW